MANSNARKYTINRCAAVSWAVESCDLGLHMWHWVVFSTLMHSLHCRQLKLLHKKNTKRQKMLQIMSNHHLAQPGKLAHLQVCSSHCVILLRVWL